MGKSSLSLSKTTSFLECRLNSKNRVYKIMGVEEFHGLLLDLMLLFPSRFYDSSLTVIFKKKSNCN